MGCLVRLPRPADAGARTGAPGAGLGYLHDHLIGRNAIPDDHPGTLGRVDRGSELGRALLEVHVQGVLVLQAAHQPAARAGDPHRVDREVLVPGHPDRDRLEVLQERGAAQIPPARPDAAWSFASSLGPTWRSSTLARSRPDRSRTRARKSTRRGALK